MCALQRRFRARTGYMDMQEIDDARVTEVALDNPHRTSIALKGAPAPRSAPSWHHCMVPVALEHVFICTTPGAPQADRLRQIGLTEGSPNQHPGQGTACRRFFFRNGMLELLWVQDAAEAQSEQTRRTNLFERWSAAGLGVSPFGIILRPRSGTPDACPFSSWQYRPKTMPGLDLQIATDAELTEPMWCYMESGRPPSASPSERRQPLEHRAGLREITGVQLVCPPLAANSVTRAMADRNLLALETGSEHLLELQFDGALKRTRIDFRPDLPLILRW
jgi:hypothetical protein